MATGASSSEEQAALLAEQGEFAAAICRYKVTIAERPDCAKLFEQLAQCLLETEQYPEAYQAASEALNLAPQWPEALLTLARCSFNTGLLPDANHQFSQYLDMQPHDVEVQAELAEVKHLQQQQLALAVGLPGLQIEQSYGAQGGPGHVVWEAGLVLSRYFVSHPELVRGKRVLELGCGTGVVGITLACLGADVTLTDIAAIVPHTKRHSLLQVCFCNRACQRAAWPVHKHYCQPVEEQSANFDLKPVQALRIAFEMEAPAEGDGVTTDLRRLYDISRSTDPAVQSSLPCGQACLWIGLCWACTNHVPQGWSFLRRASDIARQLRNWTLKGRALLYQVQTCCHFDLEGMDETEGKSLLSSSLKLWVGMLKAACLRACGKATPTIEQMTQMPRTDSVRTCARSLVNILYASLTGRPRYEQRVLLALSNTFEYHETARRQQSVRDKAAIYRQHLYAAAPNLAQPQCAMCRDAMKLLEPTRVAHGLGKRLTVLPCWHTFHFECSDLRTRMEGTCPLCRKDIKLIMDLAVILHDLN
ncbi:hypothetical protein WJX82_007240 [Trebouxia sp. C0006]